MKKSDVKLISYFRSEGRVTLTDLSRRTGLPVSTIHERLRSYVNNSLLKPSALLNFNLLGFETKAFVLIGVDSSEKVKLFDHLSKCDNVNSLFRINSGWTALLECIFKDMYSLEEFIEKLESAFTVRQKLVCYVLDELKRESFLSQPNVAELVIASVKSNL